MWPIYILDEMIMQKYLSGSASYLAGIGLFVVLVAVVSSPATGQARQVSLEELTAASSDVVLAAVSAKQSFWNENQTRISTDVRLRVTDRIKGDAAEETVVTIPGGQVGNTLYEVSDMPIFVEGEEVVVFLWKDPSGRHTVAGAAQGKLRVIKSEGGERMLEPGAAHLFDVGIEKLATPDGEPVISRKPLRLDEFVRAVKAAERK